MKLTDLVQRADQLISLADDALTRARPGGFGLMVESQAFMELRSASLSFIERVFGRQHSYYIEFAEKVKDVADYHVKYAAGILRAMRNELSGGWLVTTRGLISGEVFADFLEMSEYLLDEHYKDPAAVMAGSVLEGHLRQLSSKLGVPILHTAGGKATPRKADALNADLAKADAYGMLDQKAITSWLDLRNKAAHGQYNEYSAEQVGVMLGGIRNFLMRVPL